MSPPSPLSPPPSSAAATSRPESLLDEHDEVALGVEDRREAGPTGCVERLTHDLASELRRFVERRAEIAHLHVERHAGVITRLDVPRRTRLRAAEARANTHDRPAGDLPVEERAVEASKNL